MKQVEDLIKEKLEEAIVLARHLEYGANFFQVDLEDGTRVAVEITNEGGWQGSSYDC